MAAVDSSNSRLESLNHDLVSDIMIRLDGQTLAAVGSTCSKFRQASTDQSLWQRLCHSTWPSTSLSDIQCINFENIYAESFPLVSYSELLTCPVNPCISASDITSFVDIHYKGKCVFSTFLHGIPNADTSYNWFSNCPFKFDLLGLGPPKIESNQGNIYETKRGDLLEKLADEITLSWIIYDKKNGKAVNLSSGQPMTVQKSWSSLDEEYILSFGCIVQVEESVVPHKLAEFVITAKCAIGDMGEWMRMSEVSMSILDLAGSHINGRTSLIILNQALHSKRTTQRSEFQRGNKMFKKLREEIKRKQDCRECLAEKIYASFEIAVFVAIFYGCNFFLAFLVKDD